MNERIWELASKSGFDVSANGKFGNYSQMYKVEKFAELIVRECMNAIYDIDDLGGYHFKASNAVKQHFGVEE